MRTRDTVLRKEFYELKKQLVTDNKPKAKVTPHWGGGGGAARGNGGGGGAVSNISNTGGVHNTVDAAQPAAAPKPVLNTEVMVPFLGQSISLAELQGMLETIKPLFPENHGRVLELREVIEQGHKLRSDNTELSLLVVQTERNIANKKKSVDSAISKIDEL